MDVHRAVTSMEPLDVVVLCEINPDLVLSGGSVEPTFGQVEKHVDDARLTVGSSGAIFACGAARLGLRTAVVGLVGDDLFGKFMIDELARAGVITDGIVISSALETGLTVILNRGYDRAILTHAGTMNQMTAAMVDRSVLSRARHVHVTSYFLQRKLQPGLPALLEEVRARGCSISVDTNWDPDERWADGIDAVLRLADVVLPNEAEALALTGSPDVVAAADALGQIVHEVVIKRGARGASAWIDGEVLTATSFPIDAVDATGAGDSFAAGYLFGVLRGMSPSERLNFAVACGALSTRAIGGTSAQATQEEAVAILAARPS